jgi:hypothetical protein
MERRSKKRKTNEQTFCGGGFFCALIFVGQNKTEPTESRPPVDFGTHSSFWIFLFGSLVKTVAPLDNGVNPVVWSLRFAPTGQYYVVGPYAVILAPADQMLTHESAHKDTAETTQNVGCLKRGTRRQQSSFPNCLAGHGNPATKNRTRAIRRLTAPARQREKKRGQRGRATPRTNHQRA